jgi:hypothetical protein
VRRATPRPSSYWSGWLRRGPPAVRSSSWLAVVMATRPSRCKSNRAGHVSACHVMVLSLSLSLLFLVALFTVNPARAVERLAFRGASGCHPWGRTPSPGAAILAGNGRRGS